jgi:hypothetical protein
MSNLTPLEQLIKYVKKRYETNTSFENLVEALKEEDETILETEKERAYSQGHSDGYNERSGMGGYNGGPYEGYD